MDTRLEPYMYDEYDGSVGYDLYDYGFRYYDPAIARWHVQDPRAEKYYSHSPYNYCVNNPLLYVDPNGDTIKVAGSDQDISEFNNLNSDAMDNLHTTQVNGDGQLEILPLPNTGTLSEEGASFKNHMGNMIDSDKKASINIVKNSESVLVGDINTGSIDIGDISKIGTTSITDPGGMILHETSEQFFVQGYGMDNMTSHKAAQTVESNYYNGGKAGGDIVKAEYQVPNNVLIPKGLQGIGYLNIQKSSQSIIVGVRNFNVTDL